MIDADVLYGNTLQMLGWCEKTEVVYASGGKYETRTERLPWVLEQMGGDDQASWCSPFKGLFESMRHALAAGRTLTTSMHIRGAASEAHTTDGLVTGHEYSVQGVVQVDGEKLVAHHTF